MGSPAPPVITTATDAVRVAPPYEAVITATCAAAPELAVATNVAPVDPCATWTAAGTETPAELLDRVTLAPPDPAAWERVAVHEDVAPGAILPGAHATALKTVEANCSVAGRLTPP